MTRSGSCASGWPIFWRSPASAPPPWRTTRPCAWNSRRQGAAPARTGQPRQAVDRIKQSIALAESHDLLQATCRGYTNLSVLESSLDPPRSIETCLRGLEVARKVGDLAFQSRLHANLAVAY